MYSSNEMEVIKLSINVLLGQSFTHMADDEASAKKIVEDYRVNYDIKKSSIQQKTKKGNTYYIVNVVVTFVSEKDAFDMNFGD